MSRSGRRAGIAFLKLRYTRLAMASRAGIRQQFVMRQVPDLICEPGASTGAERLHQFKATALRQPWFGKQTGLPRWCHHVAARAGVR